MSTEEQFKKKNIYFFMDRFKVRQKTCEIFSQQSTKYKYKEVQLRQEREIECRHLRAQIQDQMTAAKPPCITECVCR